MRFVRVNFCPDMDLSNIGGWLLIREIYFLQSSATHDKYFGDSDFGISGFVLRSKRLDFLQAKCGSS